MKKIDMILNGTKEQYPSLISKLSNILEPFALLAVGKAPVYIGRIVEELGVKQCKDCGLSYSTLMAMTLLTLIPRERKHLYSVVKHSLSL